MSRAIINNLEVAYQNIKEIVEDELKALDKGDLNYHENPVRDLRVYADEIEVLFIQYDKDAERRLWKDDVENDITEESFEAWKASKRKPWTSGL